MNDETKSGVYEIVHLASGKRYVGSTGRSFNERWKEHREALKKSQHHSILLQRDWNKYSESTFVFSVLEITSPEFAIAVEQTFIDWRKSADRKHGYNISPTAGSRLGRKQSTESRRKIAENTKAQFATIESRLAASERTKAFNADPVRKAARLAKNTATRAARKLARKASGEQRQLSEKEKARYANCESHPRQSETMKALFADPVRKAAYFTKRRNTVAANNLLKVGY